MKRLTILFFMLFAIALSFSAQAQKKLFAKKDYLVNFNSKTLMVVVENNSLTDLALKDAVEKNWKLNKYDFITPDKFEQIKGDSSYCFLIRVKGIFKAEREAGIEFISLYTGGPANVEGVAQMNEIISLPYGSVNGGEDNTGYLNTYVNVIQNHVLRIQRRKIAAHMGILWYANRLQEISSGGKILINSRELASNITADEAKTLFGPKGIITDDDEIEKALENNLNDTYVTLSIAPQDVQSGSHCYKLVIGTGAHEIFYYRKQKITNACPKGFLFDDLRKIAIPFNQK